MALGERVIEIGVLGPLVVRRDGVDVNIGGARRVRLLGALAVSGERWCHPSALAEAMWGDAAAGKASGTLQSHIAHLRRVLDPPGATAGAGSAIESSEAGYRLAPDVVQLDADRFADLVERCRTSVVDSPSAARRLAEDALVLWRGAPYTDHTGAEAAAEATRLVELWRDVTDLRLEAMIRAGDDTAAVADAERAVAEEPLRERRWELLMLALVRSSRQSEALRAFGRARTVLQERTGLVPGPSLRRVEQLVLAQSPQLFGDDPFAEEAEVGNTATPLVTTSVRQVEVIPQIRFTRSSGVTVAYQSWGAGPWFVATPPLAQNIEVAWESPYWRRMFDLIGSRTRFVHFDKRGTGVSDRSVDMSFERRIEDFGAVMDACGIDDAVLCGVSEGGPLAIAFAAAHPERVRGLVLYGTFARILRAPDYPIGLDPDTYHSVTGGWERRWGTPQCPVIDQFSPSLADDDEFRTWSARYMRQSCSAGTLAAIDRANATVDVRHLLPTLRVPTIVVHRTGDRVSPIAWGRHLADHVPGARFAEFAGNDHLPWVGPNWADVIGCALDFVDEVSGTGVRSA